MTVHVPIAQFAEQMPAGPEMSVSGQLVPVMPHSNGRMFDIHPALVAMTFASYAAFLGIVGFAFMNAELVLPFVIFAVYLIMLFGIPAIWGRMVRPAGERRVQRWADFMRDGIQTGSGHLDGKAAVAQMMTVPLLIACWGVVVVVIAAAGN